MEAIDMPAIHEKILKFLLEWKKKNPDFTFSLRKSDLSKRLSSGYWFYGNDEYIAISFWTGMDWQSRVPNISFVIIPITGECFIQFAAKDSQEKDDLIHEFFFDKFNLSYINKNFYSSILINNGLGNYINSIENFLKSDKIFIDEIIKNNSKKFETQQNPKNRIGFISKEDFEKNIERTLRYRRKRISKNIPVGIRKIEIKNYGLIKNLVIEEIPFEAQWIFLTGENGTGKSTILKAIATAITNLHFTGQKVDYLKDDYQLEVYLQKDGKVSKKHTIYNSKNIKYKKSQMLSKGFVSFGPIRLNIQNQLFRVAGKSDSKTLLQIFSRPHIQLFSTISPLIDIGYVYNRNIEISKQLKSNDEKLRYIIEAITNICEGIVDIHFSRGMRYFETDKRGNLLGNNGTPFDNLASGYKSLIAMISHMMLHLYYQQPDINDPSLLEGIVIIDEIDLHFHPKMQRDLVIKLTEIFPRIQFIASTHSPIPLLGAPINSVILTSKIESERGIYIERMDNKVMLENILPNAILTSPIFDLNEIIPKSRNNELPLNTEDDYSNILFHKKIREEINGYIDDIKEKEFINLFSKKG